MARGGTSEPVEAGRLYTVAQLAFHMNVSVTRIRKLIDDGSVDHVPFGRDQLVLGDAVLRWAEANEVRKDPEESVEGADG